MFDVTIAGDINLDLILYGIDRSMPLEREIIASDFQMTLGGSAAIVAHNLAALGSSVGFIGKLGTDDLGEIALQRLNHIGVDTRCCIRHEGSTQTGVTVLLHHGTNRHILTYLGTMAEMSVNDLDLNYLSNSKHFHVSSFFLQKNLQRSLPDLCRELRHRGLTVSLDTNDDPDDRWGDEFRTMLSCVDILLPNEEEAKKMARKDNVTEAVNWLSEQVPIVVVKRGSRGALLKTRDLFFEIPPLTASPVDTIGAGDSFNAGFLSQFVKGQGLEDCVATGNATAALSTLRPGGTEAFRDREFMQSFLSTSLSGEIR
ncbi:MAG: carbohydrate kinase family protein [Acidobacteria bacterium]|nr:carbohydrate kinase family protein [Acidobacteriota bacterium]